MKIITKHYSGDQDGYLYPLAQEIGGVSGDSDACKIIFKLPKQFEVGWQKRIVFDGEIYDPVTKQYIPMEYDLSINNTFTIPPEITDQYNGKTINYHLVLTETTKSTTIVSHSSTLYFSRSARNTNIVTYLATHAFIDADFVVNPDEGVDRPILRFFRTEGNPDLKIVMELPYLGTDGKIPNKFLDLNTIKVKVFSINNPSEKTSLTNATVGDWAKVTSNMFEGEMYLLTGKYDVESDWILMYSDKSSFNQIIVKELEVVKQMKHDALKDKVLITDLDGFVKDSITKPNELAQLNGINTDKNVQEQIDSKFNSVLSSETGGASFSVPYGIDLSEGFPLGPEGADILLKTIWLDNRKNRIDTYRVPFNLAPVFDGNEVAISGLYTKTAASKKADSLVETNKGKSLITNKEGDSGACLKFENTDGTISGIAVNDGGASGVAAQIYAVKGTATNEGSKLDVRKDGIYYLKNKTTPATENPNDEIVTVGLVNGVQLVLKESDWTLPDGSEFYVQTITNIERITENSYPTVSPIFVSTTKSGVETEIQSSSFIVKGIPGNQSITFFAIDKPIIDITVVVKVM